MESHLRLSWMSRRGKKAMFFWTICTNYDIINDNMSCYQANIIKSLKGKSMKKKLLVLVMMTTLAASTILTSCGGSSKPAASASAESTQAESEQTESVSESEPEATPEATEEPEATPEATSEAASIEATRGVVENGVFTNSTFGISFPVSSDMVAYTDEQIAQMLGMGSDVVAENGLYSAEQMEQAMQGSIYDAMFVMADGSSNVSIVYENMDVTANGIYYNEDQYLQVVGSQLSQMSSPAYTVGEPSKITLGGKEYARVDMTTDAGYSQTYCVRAQDNYMTAFIYTCMNGSEASRDAFFASVAAI